MTQREIDSCFFFFFQAEDGIRDLTVTGVQTCALPIAVRVGAAPSARGLGKLAASACSRVSAPASGMCSTRGSAGLSRRVLSTLSPPATPGSGRRAPSRGAPNSGRRFSTRSSKASSAPRNAMYSRSAALRSFSIPLAQTRRRYPAASLELDQATADRIADEASGAVDVGFPHDPGPVRLGGLEADPLELGDLFRGLALRDQLEDLALPRRQRVGRHLRLGQVRLDDGLGDRGPPAGRGAQVHERDRN